MKKILYYLSYCFVLTLIIVGYYLEYVTIFRVLAIPLGLMVMVTLYIRLKNREFRLMGILSLLTTIISIQIGYLMTGNIVDGTCMSCHLMLYYGSIESIYNEIKDKSRKKE